MRDYSNVVIVIEEGVLGVIVGPMGAYYTNIRYVKAGMEYEVLMENQEFELMEETIDNDD